MNNFDRAFRRETYGILPQTDLSLEEIGEKPRKSSFWQRLQTFLFSRKKLSSLFSRSDTKTDFSAVSEGSIHEKNQDTADVSAAQNPAPKTAQDSQVVSPKLSHRQESQGSSAIKGKTSSGSKSSRAESGILSMLNRKISGRLKGQSKGQIGSSFDHSQGHVKQDTSLHSLAKRTTVYTHDLIFLTEEDRRDKYETARKKREKELSLLQTTLQQTLGPADSDELLVQDRNQIKSVLDLTNPVSRSPSNPVLETTSDQSKNLNCNEN
ncbi:uncharacterized protein LOC106664659 isoform X2 [Cimex lectularius]|nr:uncharacterized protein LOC106664659 isoform X2 [Cimex lectularius]